MGTVWLRCGVIPRVNHWCRVIPRWLRCRVNGNRWFIAVVVQKRIQSVRSSRTWFRRFPRTPRRCVKSFFFEDDCLLQCSGFSAANFCGFVDNFFEILDLRFAFCRYCDFLGNLQGTHGHALDAPMLPPAPGIFMNHPPYSAKGPTRARRHDYDV